MSLHRSLGALVAAIAFTTRPLTGQAVERTDTPHKGYLKVSFEATNSAWQDFYVPGGREALGSILTGDSVGTGIASIANLQTDVRTASGVPGYIASLGAGQLSVRVERREMPFTFEYGVTSRLSIGFSLPIVRTYTRTYFRIDSAGVNLGVNPLVADPANVPVYAAFFSNLDGELAGLQTNIAAGQYGCPGSAQCAQAQALLAEGQTVRAALYRSVYGTAAAPSGFLPLSASDGGTGIATTVERLHSEIQDSFNVSGYVKDTLPLPTAPVDQNGVNAYIERESPGLGLDPLQDTPRNLRVWPGDMEVEAKWRAIEAGTYAAAVRAGVRLPTGHQDNPNNVYDVSAGDHQTDVDLRFIQEVTFWDRLWLNLSLEGAVQMAGTRYRRVTPYFDPFVSRATLAQLRWDPGDYWKIDFAPLYRFNKEFGAGFTWGYYSRGSDRYSFITPQDSMNLSTQLGGPVSAGVLDQGTAYHAMRVGFAATYLGPDIEGGFSAERTVSGGSASVPPGLAPVATVLRFYLRYQIRLF